MSQEEISYKDLTPTQLDKLKDIFIDSRLKAMSENDLISFVRSVISDQIKGTVGNEEEKEAWEEMKDHFDLDFQDKIKEVIVDKNADKNDLKTPEQIELEKRLKYLEERKKEQDESSADMW